MTGLQQSVESPGAYTSIIAVVVTIVDYSCDFGMFLQVCNRRLSTTTCKYVLQPPEDSI